MAEESHAKDVGDAEFIDALSLSDDELLRRSKSARAAALRVFLSHVMHPSVEASSETSNLVVLRAIEVIGDRDEALRWMGTPVQALDYATPVSLIGDSDGQAKVMDVLTQLEHGVL